MLLIPVLKSTKCFYVHCSVGLFMPYSVCDNKRVLLFVIGKVYAGSHSYTVKFILKAFTFNP